MPGAVRFLLVAVLLLSAGVTFAADPVVVDPASGSAPTIDPSAMPVDGTRRPGHSGVTPLAAPIPFKDTQLGWGLALMVGAIHRFDPDTTLKPSLGALAGFYTENESWGIAAVEMARLFGDTWRLSGALFHAQLFYNFYGIGEEAGDAGLSVGLDQEVTFAFGSVLRRVVPDVYVGPSLLWMETSIRVEDPGTGPPPPDEESHTGLAAPGIQAELDTRDDDYWPTEGSIARIQGHFFVDAVGGSQTFQRYVASWSAYRRLPLERSLIAFNVNGSAVTGDVPFYAMPSIGAGQNGLRGYTQGRYRDEVMTTAQAEVRVHGTGRFGATVFGGFGQVAPSVGDLFEARVLPSIGLGARYQLTRQYPMHLRLDYAWGRKERLFYFSVSEAF